MKTSRIGTILFGCLLVAALGTLVAQKPTKTVTGVVKRAEVYRGQVRAVYIGVPQEGNFLVVRGTDAGREMLKLVGSRVKAEGYVRKQRPGSEFSYTLDVLRYEVDPPDTPAMEAAVVEGATEP